MAPRSSTPIVAEKKRGRWKKRSHSCAISTLFTVTNMLVLHKIDRNLTAVAILELTQQDTRNRQMRRNCRQLACVGGRYKQALRRTLQATRRGGHLKKKMKAPPKVGKEARIRSLARQRKKVPPAFSPLEKRKEKKKDNETNETHTKQLVPAVTTNGPRSSSYLPLRPGSFTCVQVEASCVRSISI